MATAVKTPKQPVKSARAQAEEWLASYAETTAALDALEARKKPLQEQQQELRARLREWADDAANDAEFAGGETVKLASGSFGYRNGVEKLEFELADAMPEPERTAFIVAALKKELPVAVKVGYDEKYLVKGWAVLPRLQKALAGVVAGIRRERSFVISLKK